MRIASQKNPATQILQRRMLGDAFHQPLAESLAAVRLQHKHVAEISERGKVADDTGKSNLGAAIVYSKTQRVLNRPRNNFSRDALRPMRVRQKIVNQAEIQAVAVGADHKLAAAIFDNRLAITHLDCFHSSL